MAGVFLRDYLVDPEDFQPLESNCIGKGGQGEIYKVGSTKDPSLIVAKKVCIIGECDKCDPSWTLKQQKDFFGEVEILAKTQYPSIMELIGFYIFHNPEPNECGDTLEETQSITPMLFTRFMGKGSLADHLKAKKNQIDPMFDATQKMIIIYGIAKGMAFLHKNKIIHRDLKPENVLLDDDFNPHICDFGLARNTASNSLMFSQVNFTPIYQAPELFDDKAEEGVMVEFGTAVDVYSFAIMVIYIITGEIPYSKIKNPYMIAKSVQNDVRPKIPDTIPAAFAKLLEDSWSTNPAVRPSFDQIVECFNNGVFFADDLEVDRIEEYKQIFGDSDQDGGTISPQAYFEQGKKLRSEKKYEEAFTCFTKAAKKNYPEALLAIARCYKTGHGVPKDSVKSLEFYKKAAETGNAEAQYGYAMILEKEVKNGNNDISSDVISEYYKKSSDQGHIPAQHHYGTILMKQSGMQSEGLELLKTAANEGYIRSQMALGKHYKKKNPKMSFNYISIAASAGDPKAQFILGQLYAKGHGVDKNIDVAMKWFDDARESGYDAKEIDDVIKRLNKKK